MAKSASSVFYWRPARCTAETRNAHHLLDRLPTIRPRLHVFGHNHASAGAVRIGPTLHVNASMVNSQYEIARKPIEIDLEVGTHSPV